MIFIDKIVEVKNRRFKSIAAQELVNNLINRSPELASKYKELIKDAQEWLNKQREPFEGAMPDAKVMKFSDFLKEDPKIDMVVKCIDNKYIYSLAQLTINKYYPVIEVCECNCCCLIKDDNGDELGYSLKHFKTFKVGDRFKFNSTGNQCIIAEFELDNFGIVVYYRYSSNSLGGSYWFMGGFDEGTTKIEPIEEKEPKPEWRPKFKVGDWVTTKQNVCVLRKIKAIDYKNKNYITEFIDNNDSINKHYDNDLKLWQPMQELKDELAAQHEVLKLNALFIKDLVNRCTELCSYCGSSRGNNVL